jgi:ribonuclease HII
MKHNTLLPFYSEQETEAGCDEAGRGCLAGPVVAAAVILPKNFSHPFLNDSKQLSPKQRDELRPVIEEAALAWAIAMADNEMIDQINILNASITAMHRAIDQLKIQPTSLLIDGNRFHKYKNLPHHCMIKGDGRFLSIAAASVLAKTARDEYMTQMAQTYPLYHWEQNKGYPTKKHRCAIAKYGITPLHRKTFRLLDDQLTLNL